MELIIREFTIQDRNGWGRCFSALQSYEASLEQDRLPPNTSLEEEYLTYLQNQCSNKCGKIFVALVNNEICGFVAGWIERDVDNLISTLVEYGYVSDISVLPQFRNIGIGKQLLHKIEDFLKTQGANVIKVGVLAKNNGAHDFYVDCDYRCHEVTLIKVLS